MRRNANKVNAQDPVQFWLIVGASCIALAGAVLTLPRADSASRRTSFPTGSSGPFRGPGHQPDTCNGRSAR